MNDFNRKSKVYIIRKYEVVGAFIDSVFFDDLNPNAIYIVDDGKRKIEKFGGDIFMTELDAVEEFIPLIESDIEFLKKSHRLKIKKLTKILEKFEKLRGDLILKEIDKKLESKRSE